MEREDQNGIEQIVVEVLPDGRMNRRSTARYLGCAEQTLAIWAQRGVGPRPIRVGGKVYYRRRDVDDFIGGGAA